MKKDLENLEQVLEPGLWSRLGIKLWFILLLGVVFIAATQITWSVFFAEPPVVVDRIWFLQKQEEIKALDLEIVIAKEALERHQEDVKARSGLFSISRKEDRDESERLNNAILNLERRRVALVAEYNLQAATNGEQPWNTE